MICGEKGNYYLKHFDISECMLAICMMFRYAVKSFELSVRLYLSFFCLSVCKVLCSVYPVDEGRICNLF